MDLVIVIQNAIDTYSSAFDPDPSAKSPTSQNANTPTTLQTATNLKNAKYIDGSFVETEIPPPTPIHLIKLSSIILY